MADGNLFAQPVYDDQAPAAPQGAASPAAAAPAQAAPAQAAPAAGAPQPKSDNIFAQPVYSDEPVAPEWHGPIKIDNSPGISGHIANTLLSIGKGLGIGGDELADLAASGVQAAGAAIDRVRAATTGTSEAEMRREGDSAEQWAQENLFESPEEKQLMSVRPNAPFSEKALIGGGTALDYIAESVLVPEGKLAQGGRVARAVGGAVKMQLPAVQHAVEVGRQVYQQTGSPKAAITAAFTAWGSLSAMGAIPGSMGGGALTKAATGAGIGVATGEAQREIENAGLPDDMKQGFSLENVALEGLQGAILGGGEHIVTHGLRSGKVVEQPHTIMEQAQLDAARAVAEDGGDLLDQTVAAAHANAVVGAHHDAVEYENALQIRRAEMARQAAEEAAAAAPAPGEAAPSSGEAAPSSGEAAPEGAAAGAPAPPEESGPESAPQIMRADLPEEQIPTQTDIVRRQAFERAEADQAALRSQQERDAFAQREQQLGEATRGGAGEPGPTLAEALPPEQLQALQSLKERRAAEAARMTAPPEPTVNQRLTAQNPEDDFKALPPAQRPKSAQDITLVRPQNGEDWTIAVNGSPFLTLGSEKAAKARLMQLRRDLATVKKNGELAAATAKANGNGATATSVPGEPATAPKLLPAPKPSGVIRVDREGVARPTTEAEEHPRDRMVGYEKVPAVRTQKPVEEVNAFGNQHPAAPGEPEAVARVPAPPGHNEFQGIPVTIEHPAGSERPHPNGPRKMAADYGYVRGTTDADGNHTDIMVGPDKENPQAYVVDHLDENGQYEQHKVLAGFPNRLAAMRAYRKAFPDNPLGPVTEMSTNELKDWLARGNTGEPLKPREINRMRDTRGVRFSGDPSDPYGLADLRALAQRQPIYAPETPTENNASGESAASQEAISRHEQERALGRDRFLVNPDGRATPLMGPTAVDAKAPPGHIIVQRGVGIDTHTILDRGGLSALHARGLLNRAQAQGELPAPRPAFRGGEPATHAGMSGEELAQHLQPVLARVGSGAMVHDSPHAPTVPEDVRARMQAHADAHGYDVNSLRGMYDPQTDTVHLFGSGHSDPEMARRTAVHEIVGHQGLRRLLGSDWESTLDSIYSDARNKGWMRDFAAQHELNPADPEHQRIMADEYAAHLAEHMDESPSLLQRATDAVRAGLRKLGLVHEWSDNDIRALLRKSRTNLEKASPTARASLETTDRSAPRFALDDNGDAVADLPPEHPLSRAWKFGATMEAQANYNPGFVRSRVDWAKDAAANHVGTRLAFIGLRDLQDFMPTKLMPSIRGFINMHDQMEGRRGQLMQKVADLARPWAKYRLLNPRGEEKMAQLMHASTLLGVDPSKAYESRYSNPETADQRQAEVERRAHYRTLKRNWDQLDPTGKELFQQVRDHYSNQRIETYRALEQRINESKADNNTKQALITELRQKFEAGRVQGPYFPLQRFGDLWASAKDDEGNVMSFSRFESRAQQKAWMAAMGERGFAIDGGRRISDQSMLSRIDPGFVGKVAKLAQEADPSGALADDIWQEYLKAMPEMSARKHFIHRKGQLGFSQDAMRAFAFNGFHGAHQLARLEYGNRLEDMLSRTQDEARAVEQADPSGKNAEWAAPLAQELQKRYEWIRNPKSSKWASALTKFGFGWYLGAAPATAFRIFTQNPMLAQPQLAKHFGELGASRELLRASGQWATSRGNLGDKLRGDERRAFDLATEQNIFGSTATQMLASGGSGDPMVGWQHHVTQALGFMFNAMEHHNRQSTFVASYRLARKQGLSHEDAFDKAKDLTWASHFDYANANRPRVLQNDFLKVAGLFKQYSWNVTYRLAREFRDATNRDLPPDQRKMATHAFAGMLGRMALFAGVTGMPLYWTVEAAANAVLGDKDRPFDMTAAAHAWLNQHYGQMVGDSIMTGPVGSITGASLSGGASYNDLWYRAPSRDLTAPEYATDVMGQFLGPIAAIGTNAASGVQMIREGNLERGLEHFVPPEVAALMKAHRYATQGATTLSGEPVLDRSQITDKDLWTQALGFTPQKVADQYAANNAIQNVSKAVQDRKKSIENDLVAAAQSGDGGAWEKAIREMDHFNRVNPGVAISGRGILSSVRSRAKNAAEAVNGVRVPPGLADLYDTYGTGR